MLAMSNIWRGGEMTVAPRPWISVILGMEPLAQHLPCSPYAVQGDPRPPMT